MADELYEDPLVTQQRELSWTEKQQKWTAYQNQVNPEAAMNAHAPASGAERTWLATKESEAPTDAASPLENAKASTARARTEGHAPAGEPRCSLASATLGGRWGEGSGIRMGNRCDGRWFRASMPE